MGYYCHFIGAQGCSAGPVSALCVPQAVCRTPGSVLSFMPLYGKFGSSYNHQCVTALVKDTDTQGQKETKLMHLIVRELVCRRVCICE